MLHILWKITMKSQDVILAVKLLLMNGDKFTFADLGKSVGLSASETHGALNRLKKSFIYDSFTKMIRKKALEEFLVHGIKYVFPADPGKITRGVLTGYSSPFMKNDFKVNKSDEVFVWPYSNGKDRGINIEPLYRSAPDICTRDNTMYHWLSVIDILRMNRAREREVALSHLKELLEQVR